MKTTILIKENRVQLVLHPESNHDKEVLGVLEQVPNTHRCDLYDRQGGFTMFSAQNYYSGGTPIGKDLMIVFDQDEVSTPEALTNERGVEGQDGTDVQPNLKE